MAPVKNNQNPIEQAASNRISVSISATKYAAIYKMYIEPGYYRGWSDFCYSAMRHFLFTYNKILLDILKDLNQSETPDNLILNAFKQNSNAVLAKLNEEMLKDYDVPPTEQIQVTLWPELLEAMGKASADIPDVQMIMKIAIHLYSQAMLPEIRNMVDFKEQYSDIVKKNSEAPGLKTEDYISKWIPKKRE